DAIPHHAGIVLTPVKSMVADCVYEVPACSVQIIREQPNGRIYAGFAEMLATGVVRCTAISRVARPGTKRWNAGAGGIPAYRLPGGLPGGYPSKEQWGYPR